MGKHIIRTSDRGSFRSCRQEWDWSSKIRSNLEPAQRYAPFEDGTTWHEALAVYYEPATWHLLKDPATRVTVHIAAMNKLEKVHMEQVALATKLYGEEALPDDRLEEYADRFYMLAGMLSHYFTWAPTVDNFTPVKIEIEFEVPVLDPAGDPMLCVCHGWPVMYQGRLDGLVQDPQGRYWIFEHKTAGQMGRTEWLELDAQCGSYAWAIQKMLGIRVAGIIYSRALKAAPKPAKALLKPYKSRNFSTNKQSRTTYDLFTEQLRVAGEPETHYTEYLNYLREKGNPFFDRIEVYRNEAALETMGRNIYYEAKEMIHDPAIYPSPGMFSCNGCRFREPCIAKQNGYDYQFILDELFVPRSKEVIQVTSGT